MTFKNKLLFSKKAFTLIELLIVIAIIGILFIVLVSKVDFATDKAKATGVQTDFRSFQLAFETVAREHQGFSVLVDEDYEQLEMAINKNLDNKLKIDIDADGKISMANGATDPWNVEYHGQYVTGTDGKDRGAIAMYSNGADLTFGSTVVVESGIISVSTINDTGKDDYSLAVIYTYFNGYGEVKTSTSGFSNNQGGNQTVSTEAVAPGDDVQNELLEQYNGNVYKVTNSLSTGVNYDDLDTSIIVSYGIPEDIANSYRDASKDVNTAVKMQDLLIIKDGEIYCTYGYYFKHLDAFVSLYTEQLSISNEVSIDIDDSSLVLSFGEEQIESTIYNKTIIEPSECSWTLAVATGRYIIGSATIFVNTIEFVDIGSSSVSYVGNMMWNVSIDEAKFNVDSVITSTTLDSYCLDLFDYDIWDTALQNNDVDAFKNYSYILIVPVI